MATLLKARGLYSLPNFLSEIPEGAMLEALNVIIDRNGVVEPRRGYKQWLYFGSDSDRTKQLLTYRDKILVHYGSKLGYQHTNNSGNEEILTFKDASGVTDAVIKETEAGRRIKYAEANGNLYLTTESGIKRVSSFTDQFLSASQENQLTAAGVVQALDPELLADYTTSGWMVGYSKVAYKIVIGYNDNNNNLVLGAPSGRVILTNLSPQSCNARLKIFLPSDLTTSFFVQIYRSNNPFTDSLETLDATVVPNNELLQVAEITLTQANLTQGYIDYLDTVPAEIQEVGTPLYSNTVTGEGAAQTNYPPPFAKDIALYKGSLFFANTKTRQTLDLNLLSVEGIEDIEISEVSKSGTTVSIKTAFNHGLTTGEKTFVVVPNSTLDHTYSGVDPTTDTFNNSSLPDQSVVTSATVSGINLAANTFYKVSRISPSEIQLKKIPGTSVVDITSSVGPYPRTLTQQHAIFGVYEVTVVDSDEFTIEVDTNISLFGASATLRATSAKVFPAEFVTAKQDSVFEYYFGGNQGKFNLTMVPGSGISANITALEDDYFKIVSYDRVRPYTFYFSVNDAAPPLDISVYPDTAETIPVNIILTNTPTEFQYNTETPTDSYNFTTGVFTKAGHGFTTGDTVVVDGTWSSTTYPSSPAYTLSNTELLFVKVLTPDTFVLTSYQNGPALTQSLPPSWKEANTFNDTTDAFNFASAHGFADATAVRVEFEGAAPSTTPALNSNTTYYTKALSTTSIQLYTNSTLTSGLIDITATSGNPIVIKPSGAFSIISRDNAVSTAQKIAAKMDSLGDWNKSTTNTFTIETSALTGSTPPPYYNFNIPSHGLSTQDRAVVKANGTGPSVVSIDLHPLDGYYVKVIDSDNIELYTDSSLLNRVDFQSAGTGSIIIQTSRLTVENITSGYFGTNASISLASQTNPDVKGGTFTALDILAYGYGEYFNTTTQEFLIKRSRLPLVADKIDETARSLIRVINANNAQENVSAFYTSGVQDFTPRITFNSKLIDDIPIYFGFKDVNVPGFADGATNFEPALPVVKTASSSASSGPTNLVTFTASNTLATSDTVVVYSRTSDGVKSLSSVSPTQFVIAFDTPQLSDSFNLWFKGSVSTSSEVNPNRLYFSKLQQPDSVPLLNYIDVGPKNKAIERILPLRDSLIVLKEDGIYRVTGTVPDIIQTGIDFSNFILAPDTAVVLNNLVYAFTNQGAISITENNANVVGRFIEDKLIPLSLHDNFKFSSFGISYESDRSYLLFVPTLETDEFATQCYRYNTFTQAWTRWDKPAYSGVVNNKSNLHYWGPTDINCIEQERKVFDRTDYADREYVNTLLANGYNIDNKTLLLSTVSLIEPGDALVQTQRVTLGEVQNLLYKVAIDPGIPSGSVSFYTSLAASIKGGTNLYTTLSSFAAQLSSDIGITITPPTSTDSTDSYLAFQNEYNSMVDQMNAAATLQFTNYSHSEQVKTYECSVLAVDLFLPLVTIDETPPFIEQNIVHMKRISSDIIYAPITLGDPSVMKQVRETTTLFERVTFKNAEMGYSTDLDASYDFQSFNMLGSGAFGYGSYGRGTFGGGGQGPSYPFRTYLPREKQRGRYWNIRFKHSYARFKFSMLGVSVVPSSQSERAYR